MATSRAASEPKVDPQKVVDQEEEQGYRGVKVDPTPDEHYTVAGVIAGKPTPETDPAHARKVRADLDDRGIAQ